MGKNKGKNKNKTATEGPENEEAKDENKETPDAE